MKRSREEMDGATEETQEEGAVEKVRRVEDGEDGQNEHHNEAPEEAVQPEAMEAAPTPDAAVDTVPVSNPSISLPPPAAADTTVKREQEEAERTEGAASVAALLHDTTSPPPDSPPASSPPSPSATTSSTTLPHAPDGNQGGEAVSTFVESAPQQPPEESPEAKQGMSSVHSEGVSSPLLDVLGFNSADTAQQVNGETSQAAPGSPVSGQSAFRQVKFENALDFLDQVKIQFQDNPKVYNQFLEIMKDFKAQCIDTPGVIARVTELFKGHRSLILGFNTFLPPGYKIEYVPEEHEVRDSPAVHQTMQLGNPGDQSLNGRKQPEFDHARNYVKKIKNRFAQQPAVYKSFLEILHTYHKEQHAIREVYDQVAQLFEHHQDLLDEFMQFLPEPIVSGPPPVIIPTLPPPKKKPTPTPRKNKFTEKPPRKPPTSGARKKEKKEPEEIKLATNNASYDEMTYFYKVKSKLRNSHAYDEFLKCLNLFSGGILSRIELMMIIKDLFGRHRDLLDGFKNFIGFDDPSIEFIERVEDKPSPLRLPSEIDLKTLKRYGPSYRALPKDYVAPICSGRTELCNSVLNDTWVSVPTGSEDGYFKNQRKNQYEEMLFKCEDDRFELDLVIEVNASTIRALEPVASKIESLSEEERAKFRFENELDVLHVRSIERVYGERGSEVIDAVYSNPIASIPVILARLRQKDQEWTKARREWNKIWREVADKNYYKSLDHQHYFFKQTDKKNLSPKVLLAEIKQKHQEQLKERQRLIKEKNRQEEEQVEVKIDDDIEKPSNGKQEEEFNAQPMEQPPKHPQKMEIDEKATAETEAMLNKNMSPHHLKYTFEDPELLIDVLELINFTTDRTLSKHDRRKVDTFVQRFLSPFLYIQNAPLRAPMSPASESDEKREDETEAEITTEIVFPPEDVERKHMEQDVHLFYGNSTFYTFFRLVQILCNRLCKAKELAQNPQTNSNFAMLLNPSKTPRLEDDADKYRTFRKLLTELLVGARDQNVFEDDCRALFGIQSFVLFTLDKLLQQINKQLQAMLSDEVCSKLLALYSLELTNPNPVIYRSNCAQLLSNEEERCFRFEFGKDQTLGITLTDSLNDPPQYVDCQPWRKHESWSEYVNSFLHGSETKPMDPSRKAFLLRTAKKNKEDGTSLDNVDFNNGLEARISMTSYRLFFVKDTEDYFYRHGALSKRPPKKNHGRLDQIIEKKFGSAPLSSKEEIFQLKE